MPAFRLFAAAALAVSLVAAPLFAPTPVRAAEGIKVALIVGPMGSYTSNNRSSANSMAAQAEALGATVVKVYSPNATYANVRAAVAGANIIVYWGHGSGYPNPYTSAFHPDRVNGWGLNTATTNGDKDSWSNGTLVYCGEKALKGQLTASDGAAQRKYCKGGAIEPAPGFVMVYIGSCYTAGNSEDHLPAATNAEARAHNAYYSRPMIGALGASGYFAGRSWGVVTDLLANPDKSYGEIFNDNMPWGITGAYDLPHQLVSGSRQWLTRQSSSPYWYYAFAGDPGRTFGGGTASYVAPTGTGDFTAPRIASRTPAPKATKVSRSAKVVIEFTEPVKNVVKNVTLWRGDNKISATVTYDSATRTATLTPSKRLARGVTYTVKVSANIKDLANNRIKATKWKFTTVY